MILIDDICNGKKDTKFNAGFKARVDVNQILEPQKIVFLDHSMNKNIFTRSLSFFKGFRTIKNSPKDSTFVVQYPQHIINKYSDLLYKYLKDKQTIAFIHDLNSLRYYPKEKRLHNNEAKLLNQFNVVIAHNKKMATWLQENGCHSPIVELEVFDYLYDQDIPPREYQYQISFAGNLEYKKSEFLYKAIEKNPDVSFELFGIHFDQTKLTTSNFTYKGSKDPNELLQCFQSKFGLIWDGDSIETCTGDFGNYERYNNPHKLSMNIAAECPVIVWKEAAIADFVLEHNIGIVVDSLVNLSSTLHSVSDSQYEQMIKNIKTLSKKVKSGYYTKEAYEKAVNRLKATT